MSIYTPLAKILARSDDQYGCIAASLHEYLTERDQEILARVVKYSTPGMLMERGTGWLLKLFGEWEYNADSHIISKLSDTAKAFIQAAHEAGFRMIEFDTDATSYGKVDLDQPSGDQPSGEPYQPELELKPEGVLEAMGIGFFEPPTVTRNRESISIDSPVGSLKEQILQHISARLADEPDDLIKRSVSNLLKDYSGEFLIALSSKNKCLMKFRLTPDYAPLGCGYIRHTLSKDQPNPANFFLYGRASATNPFVNVVTREKARSIALAHAKVCAAEAARREWTEEIDGIEADGTTPVGMTVTIEQQNNLAKIYARVLEEYLPDQSKG